MSMTGGISFYDKNKALFDDGSTCVASTNTADQNLILGTNKYFKWESIGSDDVTTETLTITLPAAISISRIFLLDHNFKNFGIQYGASLDFANVLGLDSYSDNQILETGFARNTAYYEFDAVSTDTIIISMDTSQVVDAQKFLTQFILTNELGTLTGFPGMSGIRLDRNDRKDKAISGRLHIEKGYETASFSLSLKSCPVHADVDVLDSLHDRELPFLAWLNGGKPDQFRFNQRGFRLEDVYQVKVDKPANNSFNKNVYILGVNQSYSFTEVV